LPEALGACALARVTTANRKIAGKIRSIKQGSPDSVLSSQFSVLSSQNWMACGSWMLLLFCFALPG
jgi:hypothetical protein